MEPFKTAGSLLLTFYMIVKGILFLETSVIMK